MSVLSCDAHGCFVMLSHALLSLFDPSPLLSDCWLFAPPVCLVTLLCLPAYFVFLCLLSCARSLLLLRVLVAWSSVPVLSILSWIKLYIGFLLLVGSFYVFFIKCYQIHSALESFHFQQPTMTERTSQCGFSGAN